MEARKKKGLQRDVAIDTINGDMNMWVMVQYHEHVGYGTILGMCGFPIFPSCPFTSRLPLSTLSDCTLCSPPSHLLQVRGHDGPLW